MGLLVGLVTGLVSAGFAWLWQGDPWLGLALVLAMMVTLGVAGLAGAAVPLLLQALRLDPALGAGVIVTTFTDVFGFFSFLGIATLLLDRRRNPDPKLLAFAGCGGLGYGEWLAGSSRARASTHVCGVDGNALRARLALSPRPPPAASLRALLESRVEVSSSEARSGRRRAEAEARAMPAP